MKNELSHRRTPKINQCKDSRQVQKQNRMLQITENCQSAQKAVLIQETGQYWRVYHCPVKNHYHLTTKEI